MRRAVGIDRKIKRAWLDAVLDRLAQGADEEELRSILDAHLASELPGGASRAKTVGIVLRIWGGVRQGRVSLRDRGVALLPEISGEERIWLHWGMTALAYPFFRDAVEVVGRMLSLQDDLTTAQVQGRMLTAWGDRATTRTAAQKLLTTLLDWDVLRSGKAKGRFLPARKLTTSSPALQLWLLEALLAAGSADEIEAQQLLRLPQSFPFVLTVGIADLRKHDGFDIHRQGLDMDMVALRRVRSESASKPVKDLKKARKSRQPHPIDMELPTVTSRNGLAESASKQLKDAIPQRSDDHELLTAPETGDGNELLLVSQGRRRGRTEPGARSESSCPFLAPIAECNELFHEGRYFGCLALSHTLVEAVIRHVRQTRFKGRLAIDRGFEKNVEALYKRKLVGDDWKARLDQMRADRHIYQELQPDDQSDRRKLKEFAGRHMGMLNELEAEFLR